MTLKNFSKKQLKVLSWWCDGSKNNKYDALICDGAVRSGKTICMSLSFIMWSFYNFDNSTFAICGKTIRSVKRNVVIPILNILKDLGFVCDLKISQNVLEIELENRKNYFYLFGGKDESSSSLIQGITLSGVMFDEVVLMPRSFVEQALARCSVKNSKFWFNCNPEYPQHWFHQEWILKAKQKNALYMHFKMEDNPSLSEEMLNRYKSIYTGTFYKRFVEGRWVAAEGIIYKMMSKDDAFCEVPNVQFKRFIISCDYGTVNPSSFGLWGRYDGIWYRINEYYYDSRKEGMQRTDEEHYLALKELAGERKIECVIVDPSAASFIAVIKKHGDYIVKPAKNNVLDGIRQVSTALKQGDIKICNNCLDSIREFGLYRWDDSSGRETPIKENDHAMDDIRYFVTTALESDNNDFCAFIVSRR